MKEKYLNRLLLLIIILSSSSQLIFGQNSAIFSMNQVPHEESMTEVENREARLFNHESQFFKSLEEAISTKTLDAWVTKYLPKLDTRTDEVVYSNFYYGEELYHLVQLCQLYKYPDLKPVLIPKLKSSVLFSLQTFKAESAADKKAGFSGFPRDLNTVHAANSILYAAIGLQLLDAYQGEEKDSTESFINNYVENKESFKGNYLTTGYNKEVFLMEIASNVLLLYKEEPNKYAITKKTFESFWKGLTQYSYDGDNSPHYDASTGIAVSIRMALNHNLLNDLKIRDDFHRMITRMATTVMNNGETAKWGKSMGSPTNNNAELINDGSEGLSWTLKMGYLLFQEPYLLYVARKYEDLRLNGNIKAWQTNRTQIFPKGINFSSVKKVVPPIDRPLSLVTNRLTSINSYHGLLLGRGDKNVHLVQDKMILSTGHHPLSPYFLMDLSYTQHKAAPDHRIGIDNLQFNGTHTCTYTGRPGNANQISRPFVCPKNYPFPIVDAKAGEVSSSDEYNKKMGFNPAYDYILKTDSALNLSADVAYGVVEYSKFQYEGVSAKRELLLLNNGIMLVLDKIKTGETFKGEYNAGVIYQVWPTIQSKDVNNRWVLQGKHMPTLVNAEDATKGFSTLFYFPQVGQKTMTSVVTDPHHPDKNLCKQFSASTAIKQNDSLTILSMIIPIQNDDAVEGFVNSILTSENKGNFRVLVPSTDKKSIYVNFRNAQLPQVEIDIPESKAKKLFNNN